MIVRRHKFREKYVQHENKVVCVTVSITSSVNKLTFKHYKNQYGLRKQC